MAERVALWGRDIDESPADLDDGYVGRGRLDPLAEPIPVVEDGSHDEAIGDVEERSDSFSYARPVVDRRPSASSTLTFKPAPAPWYRTRRGLVVLVAVIAVAVVLSIVPMLVRSPAPGSEEPTNVSPTTAEPAPTSARPTSNSIAPTLTSRPAPPPLPPPPSPPPPAQDAPVYVPQYPVPRGGTSEPSRPDIGVTRAPISVAPKPVTPIDPPRTGGGGNTSGGWHW